MSKLELILLGQFECLLPSGTRISLSMRKAEVLLAYLALTPGLRHPRERLINLLWSDRGEEQARNSLRQCLSSIKKSLGDVADLMLQVDRTTVSLIPELIDIDVHEFERLAAEGDYESLTTAANLYQGEFLEGISIRDALCQEWLDSERARFKRQFIEILSELAETQLLSHDFGNAIKSSERLVKQDPLGESGWRLLMRAYSDNGDRSHALQAYKRCQQALREELEVEPESATIELRDRIAGGESKPMQAPTPESGESSFDAPATTGYRNGESSLAPLSSTDLRIAVLPFYNLSGVPEQEYFSVGITDSIILNLSLFPGLNVKSRNSSFAFKQQIKSLGEISSELNVDYIVEGSIRRSQDQVRLTVQLIEATGGNQIWGKRYDSDLENLFDLEEELSRSIAATVTGQIESDLQRIAVAKGAAGQESYDLLLSGIYHAVRFNRHDSLIGIEKLNQCLAQDPDNVRAHVHLYSCHSMNYLERWVEDYKASFQLAAEHIQKALALSPESTLVQAYYAEYLIFNGESDKAAKHLNKALEINPNDPDALSVKALHLEIQGDFDAALETAELSYRLDPYHPWTEWELSVCRYYCGRYEAALETIENARTAPSFTRVFSVAANVKLGRIDAARQDLRVFLQECRENMLSMPVTLDEWTSHIRDNYKFKETRLTQEIIECLLAAGLEDEPGPRHHAAEREMHSIAVLPFDNLSGDPTQEYFSDGITESIILNLSLFPGLNVKSRNSSFAFKQQIKSPGEISRELEVDYLVEGSIRKTDERVRVTVQLVEATSGNQVWGKRYDAEIENLFDLEEELSRTIATTVTGQVESDLQRVALAKGASDLQAYDFFLAGTYHANKSTSADNLIAIDLLNQCIDLDPNNAAAHANLYDCHDMRVMDRWTENIENSKKLAAEHIHKAISFDPESSLVQIRYADFLIFQYRYDEAEVQLQLALANNPNDSEAIAMRAVNLSSQGKPEAALEQAELALKLDPYHDWANWIKSESLYFCSRYEDCLDTIASTGNAPGFIQIYAIAANVMLGRMDQARKALGNFLSFCRENMLSMPRNIDEWLSYSRDNAPFADPGINREIIDYLVQAGLCDDLDEATDNVPSIAVLPFENMSGDPEQEFFSDGITTDIISTLSRFDHMRVVARHSTMQYKNQSASIAEIAKQQKVRYILEGSVRKSGDRIRVNAELIDSQTEQVCWNERYDRDLEDLFDTQDEMTKNIALAMKVHLDDGDMALHRSTGTTSIKAWQLTLVAIDLQDTYIRENILEARVMANEAIKLDPNYPYAWVSLGWTHWQEVYAGWCESLEDSLAEAEKAQQHALKLAPEYSEAWTLGGLIHLMRHESNQALAYCRKAVELEPGNAEIQALMAFCLIYIGDYENARLHEQNMLKLCPVLPNWYYLLGGEIARIQGDFETARSHYQQGIDTEPESPLCRFYLIDVLMEMGDESGARKIAAEIRALDSKVVGRGFVRTLSQEKSLRDRFQANLEKFDLY
jgi:TolB-like protein/DNA-binding SARP family transcriptional activator/lipoprotein NlpI